MYQSLSLDSALQTTKIYTGSPKYSTAFVFTSKDGQRADTQMRITSSCAHTIHKHADWGAGVLLLEGEWKV